MIIESIAGAKRSGYERRNHGINESEHRNIAAARAPLRALALAARVRRKLIRHQSGIRNRGIAIVAGEAATISGVNIRKRNRQKRKRSIAVTT